MNRNLGQPVRHIAPPARAAARFGLVLLLCTTSLLLSRSGADVSWSAALVGLDDPVLVTTSPGYVRLLQQAETDAGDGPSELLHRTGGLPTVQPHDPFESFVSPSDIRVRLPDAPGFLQPQLRAPPLA